MTLAIEVAGLVKNYGHTRALDGLDLTVAHGEVHGFLGPNGAGKTTTLRILLGLLRANAGTARLLGGDPWREATTLHPPGAYVPGGVTPLPDPSRGGGGDPRGPVRGGPGKLGQGPRLQRRALGPTRPDPAH